VVVNGRDEEDFYAAHVDLIPQSDQAPLPAAAAAPRTSSDAALPAASNSDDETLSWFGEW